MGDYGIRSKRRGLPLGAILAIVALPLVIGTVALVWLIQRQHAIEEAAAWTFSGPACPTLTLAQYQAGPRQPFETFTYEGTGFGRQYGHVSCNTVVNDGGRGFGTHPVCQFTSAGIVKITTAKGDTYYSVGSRRSTVSIQGDEPSCVRAGSFTGAGGPDGGTAVGASGG